MSRAGALAVGRVWPLQWSWVWRQEVEGAARVFQNHMARVKSGADGDGCAYYGRGS